ncbi:hypothetical protein LEP1GSC043_4010 [Leptospira weilii str. Ecochallenge]|uniref:Uncharacterized protein n=1 Tax=Leptospira weilii str. Ecochallenge TaxID=1049986 RepID=N1U9S0_9LEPT|nr:hypothetical protein LEP1GSC043_4010 [Leptospira weilii str. Ecochallenge]
MSDISKIIAKKVIRDVMLSEGLYFGSDFSLTLSSIPKELAHHVATVAATL